MDALDAVMPLNYAPAGPRGLTNETQSLFGCKRDFLFFDLIGGGP